MSMFANLMQAFQGGSQPPQQPQSQIPPNQPDMNKAADANGGIPPITAAPAQEPPAPLADFKDLFTPPDPKTTPTTGPVALNLDPAKLNQMAGQLDFTKSITPELLAKINAGGPEAMTAMLTAMNVVGQQAFSQAVAANTKIAESAIAATHNNLGAQIPGMVREHAVTSALRENNPMFSNPATQPFLELIGKQFISKYPEATPAQIQEHSKKFLTEYVQEQAKHLGLQITPQSNTGNPGSTITAKDTDFSGW